MSAAEIRGPVVRISKLPTGRWEWDVWFRGPSGGGPFRRGTTRTKWGANRKAKAAQR